MTIMTTIITANKSNSNNNDNNNNSNNFRIYSNLCSLSIQLTLLVSVTWYIVS